MAIANPRLLVGHTGITWPDPEAEQGIKHISRLGFHGIELFAWVLKAFHDNGRSDICAEYGIPLISSYYSVDIADPSKREAEMAKLAEWTGIVASMGGKFATLGGNSVGRKSFCFDENRKYIAAFVNDAAKILESKGLKLNFHPHTGTPVETEAEIRSFFDAVDTDLVGFAPDIGQIQKGGADPVKICEDYISIIRLVHLKDYCGRVAYDSDGQEIDQSGFACYSPLGQGVADLDSALEILENHAGFNGPIMVELDCTANMPMSAERAVSINRDFMERLGYSFIDRQ